MQKYELIFNIHGLKVFQWYKELLIRTQFWGILRFFNSQNETSSWENHE